MRKMYFAMIPKKSFLESALTLVGVGAGVVYGAKFLLGEEKFGQVKQQVKDTLYNGKQKVLGGASDNSVTHQGPDTGVDPVDDDLRAAEEETILERIRKAAKLK